MFPAVRALGITYHILAAANRVRREALELSTDIFSKRAQLHGALERYEGPIRERWSSKTIKKREKILLSVWPDMPLTHRPDMGVLVKAPRVQFLSASKYRNHFTWPYINLEDLSRSKTTLLMFLNSRGRHLPDAFAHADLDAVHVGLADSRFRLGELAGYTMHFLGQTTPETYGGLRAVGEDGRAVHWAESGTTMPIGHGLLTLRIQQGVMNFLLECCRKILHDKPINFLDKEVGVVKEPDPIVGDPASRPSLAKLAAEAPYRVPAKLDFIRIQSLIAAKISDTKDHLLTLREDPGYFEEYITNWVQHGHESLLDTKGRKHPDFNTPETWTREIENMLVDGYTALTVWKLLHGQAGKLAQLKEQYEAKVNQEQCLPNDYGEALLEFRVTLKSAAHFILKAMMYSFHGSPNVRSLYVRESQLRQLERGVATVMPKSGKSTSSPMVRLLEILWTDGTSFPIRLPTMMDQIGRMISSDISQKNLLSPLLIHYVSDLSVAGECLRQLDLYQPWINALQSKQGKSRTKHNSEEAMTPLHDFLKSFNFHDFSKGHPSDGRFHYPVWKRRSREVVGAMRRAESNLDNFWADFDDRVAQKANMPERFSLSNFVGDYHINRTPEWAAPARDGQIQNIQKDPIAFEEPLQVLERSPHPSEDRPHRLEKANQSTVKAKIKTRGTPRRTENPAPATHTETPNPPPVRKVDKRAFKAFSFLFFTPSASSPASDAAAGGELLWKDFLHAMGSAGFGVEKMYGSAWQFTPTSLDVERSISFHEPHPDSKLAWQVARRYGRRLNRAYGRDGASFALAEKAGEGESKVG